MLPAFGTCVWDCGRRDFNREHIVGLQIAKLLDTTPPVTIAWNNYAKTGEVIEVVLPNRVCKGCNENWMRKLDRRMVAFMKDAIRDDAPVVLNEKRQLTLAHWAVKVALLFLLHMNDEKPAQARSSEYELFYAPADNFAAVFKHQRPPPRTQVWLGARQERANDRLMVSSSTLFEPPNPDPPPGAPILNPFGYGIVISLHRLVFVVRGVDLMYGGPLLEPYADLVPASLLPVWPARGADVEWPPSRELSSQDVAMIAGVPSE